MSRQFRSRLDMLKRKTIISIFDVEFILGETIDDPIHPSIPANKTTRSEIVLDGDNNSVAVDHTVFTISPLLVGTIKAGFTVVELADMSRYNVISVVDQGVTNRRLQMTATIIKE